ncbi:MAG: ABC transporter permease [Acutalibacteraceae bacterium]|nr:ABC transporter permease [Acutalibacteraceae bacterium]
MSWSMVKKNFKKNKVINIVLLLFIVISSCLMAAGTMIIIQLFDSIDSMYEVAKPPHFMQMHVGDIEEEKIGEFAEQCDYVTDWQIVDMVNIDGSNIWITKSDNTTYSLSDCMLGLGMVKENEKYDLLLNEDNEPVYPNSGEIGVPVILLDSYDMSIGDKLTISYGEYSKTFTITHFLRDPQMNSTLCSSTRFLLNEEDVRELKEQNIGELEYLIEFYFTDSSYATDFQTSYENAGMPINGQGLTYTIIRLISGLSDMLTVVLIVLVSLLLIFVAGLCLRFTILSTVEEDVREIGNMKAIGLPFKDIRNIYLQKYRILAGLGCIIGYIVSIAIGEVFTTHIEKTFGKTDMNILIFVIPILAVILTYVIDITLCKKILKCVNKISVVETISGSFTPLDKKTKHKKSKFISLSKVKAGSVNLWFALKEVFNHKKSWFVMMFVMIIATIIMIIPLNLLNTFQSPEFINYMGQPSSDIIISISTTDGLEERFNEINQILKNDNDVINYTHEEYATRSAINKDGDWINVHIAFSDNLKLGLKFVDGTEPVSTDEIALSVLNADELGVGVSDDLIMLIDGTEKKVKVSGIYQDVTNGGYTSKMYNKESVDNVYKYTFAVNLKDGVDVKEKVAQYTNNTSSMVGVNIKELGEFVNQTLGGVTSQLSKAVIVIYIMAIGLAILITFLFLKLVMIKYRSQNAILKVMGFSTWDIRMQYLFKCCFVSALGIIVGVIFVNTLGEGLVSMIVSSLGLGISKITFIVNPVLVYVLSPLVLLTVVIIVTLICSSALKKYNLVSLINE